MFVDQIPFFCTIFRP